MSDVEYQALRAGAFVIALAFAVGLQHLRPHSASGSSVRINAGFWLANVVAVGAACGACGCLVARWAGEGGIGLLNMPVARDAGLTSGSGPGAVAAGAVVTILFLDLTSYAWHVANHRLSFLWRFHQVHHSDTHYTVSTAARFHPGEVLISLPVRLGAIAVIGAPVSGVILFEIIFATSNYFEHGDIDLPDRLEKMLGRVLVVPAVHRRHHSRRPAELNTNFATIFIVWDRLFGTYGRSDSGVRFSAGLPGGVAPRDFREAFVLPARVLPGRAGTRA